MANGISVYLGLEHSLDDILAYITRAKNYGYSKVFTSLHIPEANYRQISTEFRQVVAHANQLNMAVIADISPNAYQYLDLDLHNLHSFVDFGLAGVRLDYGFKPEQIAEYSNNNYGLLIELNASTISEDFLKQIVLAGANLTNLSACHNYYPRINTGISLESLIHKSRLLQQYAIPVAAFVALKHDRRAPLYDGLPTVEAMRDKLPLVAWQILRLSGIDNIFFGDGFANDCELSAIGQLSSDVITLPCEWFSENVLYHNFLNIVHTNRPDAAEDVVRSQESRLNLLENINLAREIPPENCVARNRGSITIDNILYQRYSGEMQICKKHLACDDRVNVIGQIHHDALLLLDFIGENTVYRLAK